MDNPKPKLMKSKSSNTAVTTKSDSKRNRTCISSAGFQTLMTIKKRGVYVENNAAKVCLNKDPPQLQNPSKTSHRPRPGQKRFPSSVLTILAKTAAGTQYPDKDVPKTSEKKPKFRSKTLNSNKHKMESKFEVIQSKKEMIQTPSMYSQSSKDEELRPWEFGLPRLVRPDEEELQGENYSQIVKEVTEGRMHKEKKLTIEEPSTLVADKEDKGLYDFFVDLLETTFSVYNVKEELDACPARSNRSSKVAFEIDEEVAEKLTMEDNNDDAADAKRFYCFQSDEDYLESVRASSSVRTTQRSVKQKKRGKYDSFDFTSQKQMYVRYAKSALTQKSALSRKSNRNDLLNLLKEELRMDFCEYEEPKNLYQALRVMARNKRRSQKSISFYRSINDEKDGECVFKRRNVISTSTKGSSKYKDNNVSFVSSYGSQYASFYGAQRNSVYGVYRRYAKASSDEESSHSLEVYGYDYVYPPKRTAEKKVKDIVLSYHTSDSSTEDDETVDKMEEIVREGVK